MRTVLIGADFISIILFAVLAAAQSGWLNRNSGELLPMVGILAALVAGWFVVAFVADIYDISNSTSYLRTHRATLAALALCLLAQGAYPGQFHLVGLTVPMWVAPVISIGVFRTLHCLAHTLFPLQQRAVIFGAGESGQALAGEIVKPTSARGYELVGFIDDDPEKQGNHYHGVPVMGTSRDLMSVLRNERADILVMAVNSSPIVRANAFPNLLSARESGIKMITMPTMYEFITRKVAVEHVGTNYGVFFPLEDYKQPFTFDLAKRVSDILAGAVGCVICAAFVPLVMLGNHFLGNRGPLIFKQTRVGLHGQPFRIYKMRSMVVDAEKNGAQWASTNDPRITKFGNFLRKTRLDELPQFWNVLIGEMSLIGPRPERPEFISRLEAAIPMYRARHAVKPGLTGWAQVEYRYGASEEDSLVKLQYDLYYIKHRSLLLDLRIAAKTVFVMLGAKGR